MTNRDDRLIDKDDRRLAGYVEGVQELLRRRSTDARVFVTLGPRYAKVVKVWGSQELVHSFVDRRTGDVLAAASWSKPAKHPRSNVNDPDYGLSGVNWTGAKYMDQLKKERSNA